MCLHRNSDWQETKLLLLNRRPKEHLVSFFQLELVKIYILFLIAYFGYDKKIHTYVERENIFNWGIFKNELYDLNITFVLT